MLLLVDERGVFGCHVFHKRQRGVAHMLRYAWLDVLDDVFAGVVEVAVSDYGDVESGYTEISWIFVSKTKNTFVSKTLPSNCLKSVSLIIIPEENTSFATIVPYGRGTCEYASTIAGLVA